MKKTIAFIALLLATISVSAQFYGSLSGGGQWGVQEKTLGTKVSTYNNGVNEFESGLEGSYGEGYNAQLRVGYFFNEVVGVELGVGYLHGFLQNVNKSVAVSSDASSTVTETETLDQWGRSKAFGASLSLVVNATKNIYVRAGLLTKIGGHTELTTNIDLTSLNAGAAQIVNEFKGKLPLGFIGAIGYKYPIMDKLSVFAEVEYLNISVTRDTSKLTSFNSSLADTTLQGLVAQSPELGLLLSEDEIQYGENGIPTGSSPYSSLGLNIGVTYSF